MLKLSIIIPVYNVEQWISCCLESCLRQDRLQTDYEIIIVNDGTKDRSIDIVQEYMNKYKNIHIIHQENKGLSGARNTGLQNANGKYVWFVDSDDFVESNCLDDLLSFAEKESLDVLCFGLNLFYENGQIGSYTIQFEKEKFPYKGTDFISQVKMPPAAWVAIYRKEFLINNQLYFLEGVLHEDMEFTPKAYCLAKRIAFVNQAVYYYRQRSGSIMKSFNPKKSPDLLRVADSLYDFAQKNLISDKKTYLLFINKIAFVFSQSLSHFVKQNNLSTADYKNKPYYPIRINSYMNLKEKIKYRLINWSIPMYLKILSLKK